MQELYFDEVVVGSKGASPTLVVTADHIDKYADVSGDHTPLHTDEAYARTTHFGTRVAHGLLGLALTDGLKTQADLRFVPGMSLGWTWDFLAPIYINDTVQVTFHVESARLSRSRPGWGILVLPSELANQRGEILQRGEHRLMIPCRPDSTH
ncbi:MaoC family dehydratase [Castellaniella sp. GW247-6E4]|uniref:MaoC family dehydratase n=1 Tax=Castellaniella sp. GW247-6E4 TaxID=3140380 RepID=UPI003314D4C9